MPRLEAVGARGSFEILLVDDNAGAARLAQEAMKSLRTDNRLNSVCDAEEALEYLRRRGRYQDAKRPDLILLDLNLPGTTGFEALAEIKADKELRRIPVIVLTTSAEEDDVFRAYDLHANCYITKPLNLHQFVSLLQAVEEFWRVIVRVATR
jgi:chemotaxis family two-component system response regulator Rcp1